MSAQTTRISVWASCAIWLLATFAQAADGAWSVLKPDHQLWTQGLEGAVLVMPDQSHAMLLLRPDGKDALVSVAYPGTPAQTKVMSAIEMPDGGVRRLEITGEQLVALPPPREGFASYAFVIAEADFEILQAGLRWRLSSPTEDMVFPLKGSRVAIAEALALRLAEAAQTPAED